VTVGEASVFRFLYGMAARAPLLARDALLERLVTGLANHYGAEGCAIYLGESGWAAAAADPAPSVARLEALDRARLETIEARLVSETREHRRMTSALDLGEDVDAFLESALGVADVFGFPLTSAAGEVFAVVVIYLGEEACPFRDPDMYALCSLGDLVALAGRAAAEPA
jgi:hypothetical protein